MTTSTPTRMLWKPLEKLKIKSTSLKIIPNYGISHPSWKELIYLKTKKVRVMFDEIVGLGL